MRITPIILLLTIAQLVAAQTATSVLESTIAAEALPEPSPSLIEPVFPPYNSHMVHVEAEDAVATNFAKTTTLNYGASGYRTLQLSRYTELYGGAAFYAEYVVYFHEPGTYELWYGGTPPGPEDEVFPSYASPFVYSIDNGEKRKVYREQVNVVERYSPNFYWVKFGEVELDEGVHRIRFEVSEKRKYDGKYHFFLDSLFLIDPSQFDRTAEGSAPTVFPSDLDDRSIDTPFGTINDFRYLIGVDPDNAELYVEFSLIYAFVGDFQNALRSVNKAMLLDPENGEARFLAAKYRLWRGEAEESLKIYRSLLEMRPDMLEGWTEAGKVAAWTGKYDESIELYDRALEHFPDNLNLAVNKALTYLWASKERKANEIFDSIESAVSGNVERLSELGDILVANGYADRAAALLKESLERFPGHVGLYLSLEDAYAEGGEAELSSRVHAEIVERLAPSEQLQTLLDTFAIEQSMKDHVIQGYVDALESEPDNLILREQLVQTYFWNGLRKRAIEEYHNILVNYAYNIVSTMDRRSSTLLELIDELSIYDRWLESSMPGLSQDKTELNAALKGYNAARSEFDKFDQKVQKAKQAGNPPPEPAGAHPSLALADAEISLAAAVSATDERTTRISQVVDRSANLLMAQDEIVHAETEERESFLHLTSSTGWEWDQTQTIEELNMVSENGYALADHVLGRIYSLQGHYDLARPSLAGAEVAGGLPTEYAMVQNALWSGEYDEFLAELSSDTLLSYAPYLVRLILLAEELALIPESAGAPVGELFGADTIESVQSAAAGMAELETDLEAHQERLRDGIKQLKEIAGRRLERLMYEYQQETYLIRFELGDYYLLDEDYGAAVEQLSYVLDIDPLNTSAVFSLGVLNQRLGKWRRAMVDYRQVFDIDPRFENVSSNYNLLAREHADEVEFSHILTIDSGRISQQATLSLSNNINSVLALQSRIVTDTVRMFQEVSGPWTYQLHGLYLSVPLSASGASVTVTPDIGLLIASSLADGGIPAQSLPSQPGTVARTYFLEPVIGARVYLTITDHLSLAGRYRYGRTKESFRPEATRIISHEATADLRLGLGALPWKLFAHSSTTVGGYYKTLSGGPTALNDLFGANQNLTMVFHVADSPWTDITATQLLSFQDSTSPGASEYYAPDSALQLLGRIGVATRIETGRDAELGITVNAGGGASRFGGSSSTTDPSFQFDADAFMEFSLGTVTYYAGAQISGTGFGSLEYWLASGTVGARVELPRLLAD
jgi:tetratricopeptide (TPR) repeat protein